MMVGVTTAPLLLPLAPQVPVAPTVVFFDAVEDEGPRGILKEE